MWCRVTVVRGGGVVCWVTGVRGGGVVLRDSEGIQFVSDCTVCVVL